MEEVMAVGFLHSERADGSTSPPLSSFVKTSAFIAGIVTALLGVHLPQLATEKLLSVAEGLQGFVDSVQAAVKISRIRQFLIRRIILVR